MEFNVGDRVQALESDYVILFGDTGTVEEDFDMVRNCIRVKWDKDLSKYGYDDGVYFYLAKDLSVECK